MKKPLYLYKDKRVVIWREDFRITWHGTCSIKKVDITYSRISGSGDLGEERTITLEQYECQQFKRTEDYVELGWSRIINKEEMERYKRFTRKED